MARGDPKLLSAINNAFQELPLIVERVEVFKMLHPIRGQWKVTSTREEKPKFQTSQEKLPLLQLLGLLPEVLKMRRPCQIATRDVIIEELYDLLNLLEPCYNRGKDQSFISPEFDVNLLGL